MSPNDDVLSIGSSTDGPVNESHVRQKETPLTAAQKRQLDASVADVERRGSDCYSPAAAESPARETKRAKLSISPSSSSRSNPGGGSEEGEVEESDSDSNPREALERGKTGKLSASSSSKAPQASATSANQQEAATTRSNPEKEEADEVPEAFEGATMPANPPYYTHGSLSLALPALSETKKGSWFLRGKDWIGALCRHNMAHVASITPAVALAAFIFYIDQYSGLKAAKKKTAKQIVKKLESSRAIQKELDIAKRGEHPGSSNKHDAVPQNDLASQHSADIVEGRTHELNQQTTTFSNAEVAVSEVELEQQRRYFPSATNPSRMCLFCGQEGHTASQCTRSQCKFCGGLGHWDFACVQRPQRCGKCKQLGHEAADCVEKLNLTRDEGLVCLYCHSADHLEGDCSEMWRSFHPDESSIRRVAYLPASCCVCGAADHYSGNCSQRKGTANPTWTLSNRNRFVDPDSGTISIYEEGILHDGARVTRGPEAKIRGHAARTANVHYSESDESEPEFLGGRYRQRNQNRGQIRMASNIQMPQLASSNRGANSFQPLAGQPPLPPGPPPSILPQRPPPARDYRNVPPPGPPPSYSNNRSGGVAPYRGGRDAQRGRGGRGGRGRGRGGAGGRGRGRP